MIPTRYLYQLAEYEGIHIEWHDLVHFAGLYINTSYLPYPIISLAKWLSTKERELRCVLAHELGHHFATAGDHLIAANRTSSVCRTKHERFATKWAVDLLLPTDLFLEGIQEGKTAQGLADHFYVTLDFIKCKAELIKQTDALAGSLQELKASYNVFF